jgi:antitoxin (DNA-binding transcriptional repressor) of toxin-antitoxin stability system
MEVEMSMQTVGAYEAKTKLSALLEKVSQGETITITNRGKPIAEMRRPPLQNRANTKEVIAAIRAHRENFAGAFDAEDIKALIEEGRR